LRGRLANNLHGPFKRLWKRYFLERTVAVNETKAS
jgi:hypothetical protein